MQNFKIPKEKIEYKTLEEMQILWNVIIDDDSKPKEIRLRIYAFTYTLFFGGFRPGEFYGLKIKDIDYDVLNNDDITVDEIAIDIDTPLYYGKGGWTISDGKTDDSKDIVYIGKNAFQPLFKYIKYMQNSINFTPNTFVMINPKTNKVFSPEAIRKQINYYIDKTNLTHTKPKEMRSSHGTFLLSNGYSLETVQSRLRHTKKNKQPKNIMLHSTKKQNVI